MSAARASCNAAGAVATDAPRLLSRVRSATGQTGEHPAVNREPVADGGRTRDLQSAPASRPRPLPRVAPAAAA